MRILVNALSGRATGPAASARMFALFLAVTFAVEAIVMVLLPWLIPPHASGLFEATIDAAILTCVLAPVVWLIFIRPLERLHRARGELVERLFHVQEEDRARISRDLHDGLGQDLTSIMLRLRAIEEMSSENPVREQVAVVKGIASNALGWVRKVVREARPPVLDDLGLAAALEKQLEDVSAASGIRAHLSWHMGRFGRWPRDVETALYRGIQEAVTNAVRHSGCDRVEVGAEASADRIVARVHDNGAGFDEAEVLRGPTRPFGLLSMRERMEAVGGVVTVRSNASEGTTVEFTVPLRQNGGAP